jgi:hypothetical protein
MIRVTVEMPITDAITDEWKAFQVDVEAIDLETLFSLSRRMGTSLEMIDRTYGHLAPDAEAVELALLNAYDAKTPTFGQLSGSGEGER